MSSLGATVFAGRYRVIRRLGAGGTAAVFLARDERLGREVAVKRIHGAEVTAQTAERLRREARIMASLRHPNLVTVYDMLIDEDDLLLAMEYISGETLADVLASAPLPPGRVLALLEPVAAALDHVHGKGVVHRDLKPSNILVGTSGLIKVADLGLATAAEITKITPPGVVLGTPAYMAPEQATEAPCTPAVDVYALATIAFQALSGTLPRQGATLYAVLRQATSEPPPDLRERRPGTPAAAAEALARGMSAVPGERQGSASELLEDLRAAFRREAVADPTAAWSPARPRPARPARELPAEPAPPPLPRLHRAGRRRARVVAICALAAAFAAVLAFVVAMGDDGPSRAEAPSASRDQATATATATREAEPGRTSAPAAEPTAASTPVAAEPTATAAPAAPRPLSATATVRAFYRRAAAGRYAAAWKLAGPGMRAAFGNSLEQFTRDMASLRSIEFERVAITQRADASVLVDIRSVATHDDRIDRCSGTLRTVRGDGGRWLVEPAGVRCTSG